MQESAKMSERNEKNLNVRISLKTYQQMKVIREEHSINWSNLIKQFIHEQIKIRSR